MDWYPSAQVLFLVLWIWCGAPGRLRGAAAGAGGSTPPGISIIYTCAVPAHRRPPLGQNSNFIGSDWACQENGSIAKREDPPGSTQDPPRWILPNASSKGHIEHDKIRGRVVKTHTERQLHAPAHACAHTRTQACTCARMLARTHPRRHVRHSFGTIGLPTRPCATVSAGGVFCGCWRLCTQSYRHSHKNIIFENV